MFLKIANFVVDCLYRYCRADGLLCAVGDCGTGKRLGNHLCIDELGDFAQYVSILGRITGNDDYLRWALDQAVRGLSVSQASDGLIYHDKRSAQKAIKFFPLIRYGDTFWGLSEMFRVQREEGLKEAFDRLIGGTFKFCLVDGLPSYGCFFIGKKAITLPIAEVMTSGYLAESAVNMYLWTTQANYLDLAENIIERWLAIQSFQLHSMFLRYCRTDWLWIPKGIFDLQFRLRGRPGMNETILVKGDTYLIFSILALYRATGEKKLERAVIRWKEAVARRAVTPDGRFFNSVNLKNNKKYSVNLEENHSVIEAMIDIAVDLEDEESLELAEKACEAWLSKADRHMLIPNSDDEPFVRLDPLMDFSVNLLKLSELTRKGNFREKAFEVFNSALKHFRLPYGFSEAIHKDTLEPTSWLAKTKFLGLLIKGLLIFHFVSNGETILSKLESRLLASDR